MRHKSLPRSYKVKNIRKSLSSDVEIQHLQDGSFMPFKDYLKLSLSRLLHAGHTLESPIEVKLSGDGAPFYRSTSFTLLSFSFPSLDPQASSATGKKNNFIYFYLNHFIGTHTVAVAKGEESYKALKDGFSPVIKEINEVIEDPKITIEGITYDIKFIRFENHLLSQTNCHYSVFTTDNGVKCSSCKLFLYILHN